MNARVLSTSLVACLALAAQMQAKIITVNTQDNTDFSAGKTNLVTAINLLADGDTIRFNIPGAGAHYLVTPVGGYAVISNNNITIDGYSQSGSSPNSNTILAANNAVLKIVIDSRNGEATSNPGPGFGASEIGSLFFMGANAQIRGLCFLGPGNGATPNDVAAVNFGYTASGAHISGCWIGVDVDGNTLHTYDRGPTAFGNTVNNVPSWPIGIVVGVAPGPADTAGARAQQNVIIGCLIDVFLESMNMVIAGNKLNVFPDGMRDIDQTTAPIEAVIESGRVNNNMRVGTDGDGLNDAEERNVFGGVLFANDDNIIEIYGQNSTIGGCTNIVIAGNYFGVAVDGVTRFTNSMLMADHFTRIVGGVRSDCQFGSDFDGVSDDIEGNVIFMNNPFGVLFPDPGSQAALEPGFANLTAEGRMSFRGNKLINNNLVPFSYADGTGGRLSAFTNYESFYMDTNVDIIPFVDPATNIFPHVVGRFAPGIAPYTTIIIDVYELDLEGWTNGQAFAMAELTDFSSYTNGFPQGRKYLGSFTVANTGSFNINLAGKSTTLGPLTLTVNYSADPAGTHRGRVHTSNFSNPFTLLPGGAESVGLTHIVPDMACWFDTTGNFITNGFIKNAEQSIVQLGNWEPYASVMGDSTFLVEFNTFANDGSLQTQNFCVAKQPAAGGAPQLGYAFDDDSGTPFKGIINLSRPNGNPGRVAGDSRYGANTFVTECETSIGQLAPFQSDSRWTHDSIYTADNRYAAEQIFTLNPLTLAQTPVQKAYDYIWGPFTTNATSWTGGNQISRTGGRPTILDNGNIVLMIDDRTGYLVNANVTTFAIITAAGAVVKGPTLVDPRDIWDNMCAVKGGFVIRCHNLLYFFDNSGTPTHTNDINVSSGLVFGTGREDASRIGADIRSHYVFLAGRYGGDVPSAYINIAAWDSQTGNFLGSAVVSEGIAGSFANDRVVVAADALNRVCVAWGYQPNTTFASQIAARVLSFDGANFSYLTPSFFPWVNHDSDVNNVLGFTAVDPTIAMTTRQICIAAKGTINSTNNASAGPDTQPQETVYTVISHPAPVAAPQPAMTITRSGGNVTISWPADAGLFTVQKATSLSGTVVWSDVTTGNVAPPVNVAIGNNATFFRLVRHW